MTAISVPSVSRTRTVIVLAWLIMLGASILPQILWAELGGLVPPWLLWIQIGLLAILAIAGFLFQPLQGVRPFAFVLLTYLAASELVARIGLDFSVAASWLGGSAFARNLVPDQFNKLIVSAAVIGVLALLGYSRAGMFLVRGDLRAPITPVRWMGFTKPEPWLNFGGQWSIYLALGVGAALWITSRTPLGRLLSVSLPLLPLILVMAALNAFNEEVVFRSGILATTRDAVGRRHAWWLSALYFGIAHFWGVPYGWLGVALATFMGWVLAKAMLETRGFFWSWWIHFLQDVVIFIFIAAGTVTPGG